MNPKVAPILLEYTIVTGQETSLQWLQASTGYERSKFMDIYLTVVNLYTLLSALFSTDTRYTFPDLKDAFFSLSLAPQSQEIFAFKWRNAEEGISWQLIWTQLPQGFKNSPPFLVKPYMMTWVSSYSPNLTWVSCNM